VAAADAEFLNAILNNDRRTNSAPESLDDIIARRVDFLRDYQDEALAQKFQSMVSKVRDAESRVGGKYELTESVARAYFKTLAYKDEYEVARLHTQTGFLLRLREQYGKNIKVSYHLAPPLLGGKTDARGRPRKRQFGPWIIPLFKMLAKMRRLRGTAFDLFGMTADRRTERALIGEFEQTMDSVLQSLTADNILAAAAMVNRYLDIRGYGPVKEQALHEVRADIQKRLASLVARKSMAA
jgi:indolepyruvate ferredoxin oxidoreductase